MGLFRHRKPPAKPDDDAPLSAERRADLEHRATALTATLDQEQDPERRIALLNELAATCCELGDTDAAIAHYEASMGIREQFGPAYNGLLSLYNDKLKTAAQAQDDAGIQRWTTRLDDLLALSKRVMRSRY